MTLSPWLSCTLCGMALHGTETWEREFRALHRPDDDSDDISVTGVGLHLKEGMDRDVSAPRSPDMRWNDSGPRSLDPRFAESRDSNPSNQDHHVFPANSLHRNQNVFFFHDVCWSLLRESSPTGDISQHVLPRLFCIFDSFRAVWGRNIWATSPDRGPNYHDPNRCHCNVPNVPDVHDPHQFPWDPRSETSETCAWNPLHVPEIGRIIDAPPKSPPEVRVTSLARVSTCPFGGLSEEICAMIAAYLTNSEFLNARLATRSFWPLFHSQQFWLHRCRSDRPWLFEALRDGKPHDWRGIYCQTRTSRRGFFTGMAARRRMWNLASKVWDVHGLSYYDVPYTSKVDLSDSGIYNVALGLGSSVKRIREFTATGEWDSRSIHLQRLPISKDLCRLSVALRQGYITGLQLEDHDGHKTRVGWWSSASTIQSCTISSPLQGLNLGIKENGISCVQCITEDDEPFGPWIGYPGDELYQTTIPQTSEICLSPGDSTCKVLLAKALADSAGVYRESKRIRDVYLYFDSFKLMAIAATGERTPTQEQHAQGHVKPKPNSENRIHRSELWFPSLPPTDVYLNAISRISDRSSPQCQGTVTSPFLWIRFGGEKKAGEDLARLVNIKGHYEAGDVKRLEFRYKKGRDAEAEEESRFIGRQAFDGGFMLADPTSFDIDGPGGERIEKVEVHEKNFLFGTAVESIVGPTMTGFTITTNRGRSCFFGDALMNLRGTTVKKIQTVPGTAITGFYVVESWDDNTLWYQPTGFQTLGVISESLN